MNFLLANSTFVFDPVAPIPVLLLFMALFAALTIISYFKFGEIISRTKNFFLTLFRMIGIALVFLLLLQPSQLQEIPPPKINRVTLVAVDTSRSMKQADVQKMSRLEVAKNLLIESDLLPSVGGDNTMARRLFEFNTDAMPVAGALESLRPDGPSTRFHHSINSMFSSLGSSEEARALILLSDGHDFELINPVATGAMARSRQTPIYAVAFGKQGKVRDASARITNYQPYSYVKQKARISAMVRLVGCEFEDVTIQLIRRNEVIQTKYVNADENDQIPIEFEVVENEVGQFEYEIKVVPLEGEIDVENNSALTYLNVIDQQIQVLLLEGAPYWDTTFLQRSLMRNDKIDLDCILQYSAKKAHTIRKKNSGQKLQIPTTQDEFNHYDVIVLGKSIDAILETEKIQALQTYVKEHGGTVVFSRGKAFETATNELEPVIWVNAPTEKVNLQISREGQSIAPFKILSEQNTAAGAPPDLIAGHKVEDRKPLAAVLAQAQNRDSGETMPGFVHRRFGQGQVLSVGVDGLWRWAFNAKIEGVNTMFDRFWDQMILWLMAGRDFLPSKQFSFRCSSANVLLGEKIYFKLVMRDSRSEVKSVPVTIFHGDREIGKTTLAHNEGQSEYRLSAEFLPEKVGKYRAVANLPDGSHEESKFIVFNENLEETEVATDVAYLRRLCESSGGRVLAPDELKKLSAELDNKETLGAPRTKLVTIWDRVWLFYLIGLTFGIDWYLRRKWGLC